VFSGLRVALSRFRSLAGFALALVSVLPGLCLPPVVLMVLCFCFGRLFRLAWILGRRPFGPSRWFAGRRLSGWLFCVARSGFWRVLGLRRFWRMAAVSPLGYPLGPPWLGASLPGWAVLVAACPGFLGSLLAVIAPVAGSYLNIHPRKNKPGSARPLANVLCERG
jgi:hypothetical protein